MHFLEENVCTLIEISLDFFPSVHIIIGHHWLGQWIRTRQTVLHTRTIGVSGQWLVAGAKSH